jgi:NADPH2:quinone reductase
MKALMCKAWGWPQPLPIVETAVPEIAKHEVLVKVAAAGLNFADSVLLAGRYQSSVTPPFIPGAEFSGTIVSTGAEVTHLRPGDRVMGQVEQGAYAEYVAADSRRLVRIPDAMPMHVAAGFFIPYGTAFCGLTERIGNPAPGSLLVIGASGGVGLAAVELGRALGWRVIGAARGEEKLAVVRAHGAIATIDYAAEDLTQAVKRYTGDAGVDVVFDTVGGDYTQGALRCLAWEGKLVLVGFTSGSSTHLPTNHVLVKNCDIVGLFWGSYQLRRPQSTEKAFDALFSMYRQGLLQPRIAGRFPLSMVDQAINRLLNREFVGKIIIDIEGGDL